MATPGIAARQAAILVNLFDGARRPLPANLPVLLRVIDGHQRVVWSDFIRGPRVQVSVPFHDNFGDWYTIVACADGYRDAGLRAVRAVRGRAVPADLMLIPKESGFRFMRLGELRDTHPLLYALVSNGVSESAAAERYADAMERRPAHLGALLTIASAVAAIPLAEPGRPSPLHYYWQVEWDLLMPDRFWAWVDARLVRAIANAARLYAFAEEPSPELYHPGIADRFAPATRSWKQTRFDVANVQLTFHELDFRTIELPAGAGPCECVIVETDIDYYKDVLAHGLLEVLPHWLTGGKSDPNVAYLLRWMAGRQEGLDDFDPPLTIEA